MHHEDIATIETIIKHDFVGDARFVNHATGNTSDMSLLKFQPGHRKRTQKFVAEAKYLVKEKTRANESLKHKGQKRNALQPICHRIKQIMKRNNLEKFYITMIKVVIALSLIC